MNLEDLCEKFNDQFLDKYEQFVWERMEEEEMDTDLLNTQGFWNHQYEVFHGFLRQWKEVWLRDAITWIECQADELIETLKEEE